MKLNKLLLSLVLATSITVVGCGVKEEPIDNVQKEEQTQNEQVSLSYDTTKEVLEVKDKNTKVFYPQIKDYPGELLMDYINQSLKKTADLYANEDPYTDVKVDYEITKMDNDILSVLFKGTGKIEGHGEINIKHSVNIDMKSSNEINYNNLVKDNDGLMKMLNKKAKEKGLESVEAEGIRVYFEEENVVFYYMPLDDSAKEFIELSIPMNELKGLLNTEFGEIPAS
ncbi:hypothetical protein [Tepidibacter hydrothermalis]|uniref:DUF3298 domain-containing protein n=1 Tax=Tepidibacter hydrothermalis TaxID=3036126 RepID=A0ABY8EIS8_9FIRM|nr:hypothetical protein [Tepidibacter hydrothermalis]WFD11592.1 hypothetical protein P4S50_05815 [Tepidibacter hydrothermalis]